MWEPADFRVPATRFLPVNVFIVDEQDDYPAAKHTEEIAAIHSRPPFFAADWTASITRE